MQHASLAEQGNPLAHLVRTLPQPGTPFISHLLFIAPTLLFVFRRPNITRKLHSNLSVEIENLKGSPGLSYCRFYDANDRVFLPQDLMCIHLANSSEVSDMTDPQTHPAFILCETSWYAFCNKEAVLAYVHSAGSICLPSEVVSYFRFRLALLADSAQIIRRSLIPN